ncbi:hypothetical protein [Rhizobium mayense]|uniref:Uncharacterized protein n=1 Tax=Rhizobium mayense TaxID=1312184 RepID=A0ABT7JXA3_9HYPH|nr:hypothetical protein [Rhizobium mayense]MDL2400942.1 hypothetical protein [Rhizobium mayense]
MTANLCQPNEAISEARFLGPLTRTLLKYRNRMNRFRNAFLIFPMLAVSAYAETPRAIPVTDRAADCTEVVEKALAKTGGRLLSFRPGKKKCTVVILLQKEGERPEKLVLQIDRDLAADNVEQLLK